jgi:hypothetical protein
MACIGDAKRQTIPVKGQPNLGPGTYETERHSPPKRSFAPFASCEQKFTKKSPKNIDIQVGPGTSIMIS